MSAGKILVVRGGAIGDFILTLPVFAALREQFPSAHLEVLGYAHIASLAKAAGLVDGVRSIEARPLAAFFARNGSLEKSLQEFFAGFSIIISYLYDPDGIFQANVARCSKAQFIVGPHRPNDSARIHATEVLLKPLERLAIFAADSTPRLHMGPVRARSAFPLPEGEGQVEGEEQVLQSMRHSSRGGSWLAVHPGSGSESKNWLEAKWAAALSQLASESDLKFLLIGGEAEAGKAERLAAKLPRHRVDLAQNLPLTDLAARISSCAAFVGHDSGITHLAAALGLPIVALWGESAEDVWKPKGAKISLVKEENGLSALSVERVARAVWTVLP